MQWQARKFHHDGNEGSHVLKASGLTLVTGLLSQLSGDARSSKLSSHLLRSLTTWAGKLPDSALWDDISTPSGPQQLPLALQPGWVTADSCKDSQTVAASIVSSEGTGWESATIDDSSKVTMTIGFPKEVYLSAIQFVVPATCANGTLGVRCSTHDSSELIIGEFTVGAQEITQEIAVRCGNISQIKLVFGGMTSTSTQKSFKLTSLKALTNPPATVSPPSSLKSFSTMLEWLVSYASMLDDQEQLEMGLHALFDLVRVSASQLSIVRSAQVRAHAPTPTLPVRTLILRYFKQSSSSSLLPTFSLSVCVAVVCSP